MKSRNRNRFFKERRRVLQILGEMARRNPLNPAQRERLDRSVRLLRGSWNQEPAAANEQLRRVIEEIATLALEILDTDQS